MSRFTEAAPEFEIVPVTAEFPIKTSPRSTCKFAKSVLGEGPTTNVFDTYTFVVVKAFDMYKFPGNTDEPSGLKFHVDESDGVATSRLTPPELIFTSETLPAPSFQFMVIAYCVDAVNGFPPVLSSLFGKTNVPSEFKINWDDPLISRSVSVPVPGGPCGPVAPVAPCGPVGPCGPAGPPGGPRGPGTYRYLRLVFAICCCCIY